MRTRSQLARSRWLRFNAVPVARSSAVILVRNSLVLIGKFLLPFFVAHFAAEFTVEPALVVFGASKI